MECIVFIKKKRNEILSSKTWREPKTVIFPQLKGMTGRVITEGLVLHFKVCQYAPYDTLYGKYSEKL